MSKDYLQKLAASEQHLRHSALELAAAHLEPEPTTANSVQAQIALHLWMLTKRDFAPDASDMEIRHRSTIALLEQREDVDQSTLLALMSECLEIHEDNPRSEYRAF